MDTALVIGGTRFIGRHLVEELLAHDYAVTIFNRGSHENPFADREGVSHVEGDRGDAAALAAARDRIEPDAVFDCVAYYPAEVRVATGVFADVGAYVYISSGAAYGREELPKREGVTPLHDCTPEQARSDDAETYGPRKAEGDREIFRAAENGVRAMSVRPCIVYGPHDYTARLDYWIDRVREHDRILVPGDGTNVWHRVYVEDVASAMRIVAESGEAGAAYNVADRRAVTLEEMVDLIADAADTDVEVVHAGERELAAGGIEPSAFVLYRSYPHLMATERLAALGWESTPLEEAMAASVADQRGSGRTGRDNGPDRADEERVLEILDTL